MSGERSCESADHDFPEMPEDFEGCVSCACGQVRAYYARLDDDPALIAQRRAGEEDQSMPGWDFGA